MVVDEKREFESGLREVLVQLDLTLSSEQMSRLYTHYSLLKHWNQRMNLTAIRSLDEVIWRHFGESLAVAKVLGAGGGTVVDVGSGGGFPGFPIAVCWPARSVVLLESVGKKAVFLKELSRLQRNVSVHAGRFEEFIRPTDWIVMRAVGLIGVSGRIRLLGKQAALLLSETQVAGARDVFDAANVFDEALPWNPAIRILSGTVAGAVPRET